MFLNHYKYICLINNLTTTKKINNMESGEYNFGPNSMLKVVDESQQNNDAPPAAATPETPAAGIPPALDTPAIDTPASGVPPETPAPVAFDEAKYIKENFQGYESKEALSAALIRAQSAEATQKELNELKAFWAENDFADDYARSENKFVKGGGDRNTFREVTSLNLETITPLEAVKAKLKIDNKDLTPSEIDLLVRRKYKTDDDNLDDEDVIEANINLKMDGKAAIDFLGKYKAEKLVPPSVKLKTELQNQQAAQAQEAAANLDTWNKNYDAVVPKSKIIKIALDNENTTFMDYEVQFGDDLKKEALYIIEMNGMKFNDPNSRKEIESYLVNRKMIDEVGKIALAVATKVKTERDLHWINEVHNPNAIGKQDTPPDLSATQKQAQQNLVSAFIN